MIKITGKYNNELAGGENPVSIENREYRNQIIADFS